jgi:hypothetical protein
MEWLTTHTTKRLKLGGYIYTVSIDVNNNHHVTRIEIDNNPNYHPRGEEILSNNKWISSYKSDTYDTFNSMYEVEVAICPNDKFPLYVNIEDSDTIFHLDDKNDNTYFTYRGLWGLRVTWNEDDHMIVDPSNNPNIKSLWGKRVLQSTNVEGIKAIYGMYEEINGHK